MAQEGFDERLQVEQAGLAVDQRHHVHPEGVLHLRFFVQIVQDHFGHLAAFQLDHDAHARLVGLVADLGDAFETLLADQLADADQQLGLVHLIRQFVDDDRLADALLHVLEVGARPDHHAAAAGAIALADAVHAVDDPGGREVRRLDDVDDLVERGLGFVEDAQARVDDVRKIVRRNVGRHSDGDAGRTIDEEVRELRREDERFFFLAVVVRAEIDGFLVDVGEQFGGDAFEAALGVPHGRRVVAVDRAEIALAVDQRVAEAEVLGHPDQGVVDGIVTVRVVLAHDVTDDTGALHVRAIPLDVRLVHREQDPAMDRLQPVPHIGQCPAHDHAHRVIKIRAPHLLFQRDRQGFLSELLHGLLGATESVATGAGCDAFDTSRTRLGPSKKGRILTCTPLPKHRRNACTISARGMLQCAKR